MKRTLNERKMVVFVVQTSRYFGPCRILPYPAVSCRICRILPYPVVSCRILRILPYPAVSCCILPYPAVSCRILPYPAVSCRILPYPAVSNTRNRETPFAVDVTVTAHYNQFPCLRLGRTRRTHRVLKVRTAEYIDIISARS